MLSDSGNESPMRASFPCREAEDLRKEVNDEDEDDGDDAMDRKKASMSGGWIVPPSLSLPSWEVTMLPSPKMAAMVLPIDDAVVLVEMNIVANAMRRGMKIPNNHTIAR